MRNWLQQSRGQFIPLSAMVMFTVVVFLVAVVNIYTATRTKLQIQNLADAAALNLATQQAQAFNLVADKNEWLNHMVAGIRSPHDPEASAVEKDCSMFHGYPVPRPVPGISCVENWGGSGIFHELIQENKIEVFTRHIFHSRDGAINYAMVIYTVNQAQKLFVQAYNSFLGVQGANPTQSTNAAAKNFTTLLKKDIPALDDPTIRLVAWNTSDGEQSAQTQLEHMQDRTNDDAFMDSTHMQPLDFEIDHDIRTVHYIGKGDLPTYEVHATSFGELLSGCVTQDTDDSQYGKCGPLYGHDGLSVGWMRPSGKMPQMRVETGHGDKMVHGVGVAITKSVKLPVIGTKILTVRSKAYVVAAGGDTFKPTYWVKLGR